jgi:hypothetical protein
VANLVAAGLTLGFLQSCWGEFTVSRCWLALAGKLPWRLMTFLGDAHARGVLRQVGAIYHSSFALTWNGCARARWRELILGW